jgi:hypothetical protein
MPNNFPTTYQNGSDKHELIKFSRGCKACELHKHCLVEADDSSYKDRKYRYVGPVGGSGPDDLTQIKLIIISEYNGAYELSCNYPFYSNEEEIKPKLNRKTGYRSLLGYRNAGNLIRYMLETMYGLDTYTQVWCTTAIKCSPGPVKAQEKHVKVCSETWLKNEISILDEYAPTVPILVLGNLAFKGLQALKTELPKSLQEARHTNSWLLNQHPLVFSFNPTAVAKNEFRIETELSLDSNGSIITRSVAPIERQFPGTPYWFFEKDLLYLQDFLGKATLINVKENEPHYRF